MAGDWLKVEINLFDKPEVLTMSERLGISVEHVVGCLIRVWAWFDQHTEDGNAASVTSVTLMKRLCNAAGVQGFAQAMVEVGWLTGTSIPNFQRHNGKSAKIRALTRDRVRVHRNADVTPDALLEKRREEKRIKPPHSPPQRGAESGNGKGRINGHRKADPEYTPGFEAFWAAWPALPHKAAKGKAFEAWTKKGLEEKAEEIIADVQLRAKYDEQWTKFDPMPVTYLNQRRYDDGFKPPPQKIPGW